MFFYPAVEAWSRGNSFPDRRAHVHGVFGHLIARSNHEFAIRALDRPRLSFTFGDTRPLIDTHIAGLSLVAERRQKSVATPIDYVGRGIAVA